MGRSCHNSHWKRALTFINTTGEVLELFKLERRDVSCSGVFCPRCRHFFPLVWTTQAEAVTDGSGFKTMDIDSIRICIVRDGGRPSERRKDGNQKLNRN
jgi:hypothetical protein